MKTPMYDLLYEQSKQGDKSQRKTYAQVMGFVLNSLNESRIFKIPTDLTTLFLKSDAHPSYNLPFKTIFLETKFSVVAPFTDTRL